jgi:polyhydroxyalkanoate synthesis repressor PhaR
MEKATIRKYGDRRLYDATASRYVKLEDIARMVREGIEVEVLDARSGKDLTRVILTQIIVENARDREMGPPLALLRQLIMASDKVTHEFLASYLNSAMELYQKAQQTFQTKISDARSVVSTPLDFMRRMVAGQAPAAQEGEMEELRRRVQELEARLVEIGERPRRKPGKRKKRVGQA